MKDYTTSQYKNLNESYNYFNRTLFGNELPPVFFTFVSSQRGFLAFAANSRWRDLAKNEILHEIAFNSLLLSFDEIEVYSTLVHEMCHIWQFEFGKPSRNGYHNTEWGRKMESVGLVPSDTGKPGGKKTGQKMSDYPREGGVFLKALGQMPKEIKLPLTSIRSDIEKVKTLGQRKRSSKTKYTCKCNVNIWGKRGIKVFCKNCNSDFKVNEPPQIAQLIKNFSS